MNFRYDAGMLYADIPEPTSANRVAEILKHAEIEVSAHAEVQVDDINAARRLTRP